MCVRSIFSFRLCPELGRRRRVVIGFSSILSSLSSVGGKRWLEAETEVCGRNSLAALLCVVVLDKEVSRQIFLPLSVSRVLYISVSRSPIENYFILRFFSTFLLSSYGKGFSRKNSYLGSNRRNLDKVR